MASTSYAPPVDILLTLGEKYIRGPKWVDYVKGYGLTDEHIPQLIQMAIDQDLNWAMSDSKAVWAPVHAWRALGQLKAKAAVEPLISVFDQMEDSDWFREEMPDVFALIGPSAIEPLQAFLANPEGMLYARWAAASSLVSIGTAHPKARADCVAALERQLAEYADNSPVLNGALVACLMDLEAQEAMPTMEKAFAARQVDEEIPGTWKIVKSEMGLMAGSGLGSLRPLIEVEPHFEKPKSAGQSAKSSQGFGAATKLGKKKRKKQK